MEIKYISLGSTCESAHCLKKYLRNEAYPFDWITTIDSEKFIKIIEDDFKFFLDVNCLLVVNKDPFILINNQYNIEFLHEGMFNKEFFFVNMKKLQEKYNRRIERFRNLKNFTGKVIFFRHSYKYSVSDPWRIFKCNDNLEISDSYSINLYNSLKKYFDKLNFTLIIINNHNENNIVEEKIIHENLIKIKCNTDLELEVKSELYKKYFINENL